MKVVFLSTLFRDPNSDEYRGGGEISNRLLLESISDKHDVYVVSALGHTKDQEQINGVTYFCLASHLKGLGNSLLAGIVSKIFFKNYALNVCKKICPDVVISGTLEPSIAKKIRRALGCKAGVFIRAYENFGRNKTIRDVLRILLYGNTKAKSIDSLDFIITNSEFMASRCTREFDTAAIYTVYPPLDISEKRETTAESNSLTSILAISGTEKKGKTTILHLARALPEINFAVLGYHDADKADYHTCQNVTLIKWVKEPEKVMQSYDLVIVPSVWEEPFGRVSAEALQLGRLVLVSDVGGLPETVCHKPCFIVPHNSHQAWVEKINEMKHNKNNYKRELESLISSANRYSIREQSQNFLNTLHKIVSE